MSSAARYQETPVSRVVFVWSVKKSGESYIFTDLHEILIRICS
jgi:hypothetical protein